jgi:tRNA(His) 5'-end guanylyltransferase
MFKANVMSSESKDKLGDRMKEYERIETARKFHPSMPIYARIDGKNFSNFTRGLKRPFDMTMTRTMIETTKFLVEETHALCGYVQSDEISLAWRKCSDVSSFLFDGKSHKLHSVLASMAAGKFNKLTNSWAAPWCDRVAAFDARVCQMPFDFEITNMFLWRAQDATKNAVSMATRAEFSAKQMHGKNQPQMIEMLTNMGIDFYDHPAEFRNGTFIVREKVEVGDTTRSIIKEVPLDTPFSALPHNERHAFIFGSVST